MIEKATSQANIQSMLETLRKAQADAAGGIGQAGGMDRSAGLDRPDFAALVRGAIGEVNDTQIRAQQLQTEYERGDVPLTDVVLGMQKSSLSFEATLQVRNKVLKAYEDILNMPV